MNDEIKKQLEEIKQPTSEFKLIRPCKVHDGILPKEELFGFDFDEETTFNLSFFIPASGSGSRMFAFLFTFIETRIECDLTALFFRHLKDFPFYDRLELTTTNLNLDEKIEIAERLLFKEPFNFSTKPKGLIPFFKIDGQERSPFQLHALQALKLFGEGVKIHFTVQEEYKEEVLNTIRSVVGNRVELEFSFQDKATDAYCFDEEDQVIRSGTAYLRRPAGHGALLDNLNRLSNDVLLVKNIDNVQNGSTSQYSLDSWKKMLGLLTLFKTSLKRLIALNDVKGINELNARYQFVDSELTDIRDTEILVNRPIRICGMVRNQGQPGGGPFWIDFQGEKSKQIVELSQVSLTDPDQAALVKMSTHFNPVFMVCDKTDLQGKQLDLTQYKNDLLYLKVVKTDNGRTVRYRELPGLWNGSMHNWITIFVELPAEVFTPVKTIVDLI